MCQSSHRAGTATTGSERSTYSAFRFDAMGESKQQDLRDGSTTRNAMGGILC